jgi:hypothetical protein
MRLSVAALASAAFLIPSAGMACSVFIPEGYEGSSKQLRDVKQAIGNSPALIDGEVVRAGDYGRPPALVYAHRVLKGPNERWFKVGTNNNDSCAIPLTQVGARMRMILWGGPNEYALLRDQSEARIEDKILGSDRRKDYPYFSGPRPEASESVKLNKDQK